MLGWPVPIHAADEDFGGLFKILCGLREGQSSLMGVKCWDGLYLHTRLMRILAAISQL